MPRFEPKALLASLKQPLVAPPQAKPAPTPRSTDEVLTLDALMARQKEVAAQQGNIMQQPVTNIPQGLSQMAWAGLNALEGRSADKELAKGNAEVADAFKSMNMTTGEMSQEGLATLMQRNPELGMKFIADMVQQRRDAAKQEHWVQITPPANAKPGQLWERNSVTGETRAVGGQATTQVGSGETEFEKEAGKKQAGSMIALADDAVKATVDASKLNQLEGFLNERGGAVTGFKAWAASLGFNVEGADDLAAATALINSMVPSQREPGSGTMSDRDVELFKSSLPRWLNQPGGNKKIMATMKGIIEYRRAQGLVAQNVLSGAIPRTEAYAELMKVKNPMLSFPLPLPAQLDKTTGQMGFDPSVLTPGQTYEYPNGALAVWNGGNPANADSWTPVK